MEDAFAGSITERSVAQSTKAWVNRTLEQNPLPTIWITNSTACLDPAFVRRFDLCLELPMPPKPQRARLIRAACGGLVDAPAVARLASDKLLAPAVLARAAARIGATQRGRVEGR